MAYDEAVADRARALLSGQPGLGERKMFGGLTFLLNGNMCCGVINDEMMMRIGPERYEEALTRPHVRPCDFTGRPMKGLVMLSGDVLEDGGRLKHWIDAAVAFAGALPPK